MDFLGRTNRMRSKRKYFQRQHNQRSFSFEFFSFLLRKFVECDSGWWWWWWRQRQRWQRVKRYRSKNPYTFWISTCQTTPHFCHCHFPFRLSLCVHLAMNAKKETRLVCMRVLIPDTHISPQKRFINPIFTNTLNVSHLIFIDQFCWCCLSLRYRLFIAFTSSITIWSGKCKNHREFFSFSLSFFSLLSPQAK